MVVVPLESCQDIADSRMSGKTSRRVVPAKGNDGWHTPAVAAAQELVRCRVAEAFTSALP